MYNACAIAIVSNAANAIFPVPNSVAGCVVSIGLCGYKLLRTPAMVSAARKQQSCCAVACCRMRQWQIYPTLRSLGSASSYIV